MDLILAYHFKGLNFRLKTNQMIFIVETSTISGSMLVFCLANK